MHYYLVAYIVEEIVKPIKPSQAEKLIEKHKSENGQLKSSWVNVQADIWKGRNMTDN